MKRKKRKAQMSDENDSENESAEQKTKQSMNKKVENSSGTKLKMIKRTQLHAPNDSDSESAEHNDNSNGTKSQWMKDVRTTLQARTCDDNESYNDMAKHKTKNKDDEPSTSEDTDYGSDDRCAVVSTTTKRIEKGEFIISGSFL